MSEAGAGGSETGGAAAAAGPSIQDVFEDFVRAVHQVENAIMGTRVVFADGDLSASDWVVLRNIPRDVEMRVGLLSRRTGLSRQRINKIVEGLSDAMLIDVRTESGDKRARLVKLTGAGAKALDEISRQMRAIAESTAGNAKPEMLQRFASVAQRIVNSMATKA